MASMPKQELSDLLDHKSLNSCYMAAKSDEHHNTPFNYFANKIVDSRLKQARWIGLFNGGTKRVMGWSVMFIILSNGLL